MIRDLRIKIIFKNTHKIRMTANQGYLALIPNK